MPAESSDPGAREMATTRGMVSVAMATYNGAEFVTEQIASILPQLAPGDEIVIVDDASTDDTVEVISRIDDPRIRLVTRDVNWGYVRTFEQALGLARGEYLFLCDQDDVWIPGRVDLMVAALADHQVIASNLASLGGPNRIPGPFWIKDWRLWSRDSGHAIRNLLRLLAGVQCYWGCAMAVRRDALDYLLPFPRFLNETHDQWIGLCGNMARSMGHMNSRTVWRRVHDSNLTPTQPRGVIPALRSRVMLIRCLAVAWSRGLHLVGSRKQR
ncbi:glycosyltransferase [Propionibacterium freudenreichii]|uniref:glycosyltransferase n=1 Tax=Propionibacterium freudenreichii TaxID=1744 RepID=UPI002550F43F|nr:glycosyltransferase [Propionibacterium freudenreichii]